jgi:hypothetical protein
MIGVLGNRAVMLGFVFHAHLLVRVDQVRGKERRGAGIAVPLCRLEAVQVVLGGHVKPAFLRGGGGPEVSESDFVDVQAWVHDNNLRCSAPQSSCLGLEVASRGFGLRCASYPSKGSLSGCLRWRSAELCGVYLV